MADPEVIETPRLRIVPFGEEHLTPRYVGWLNDPEVVRYSEQRFREHTLESCRDYWNSFRGTPHYFWAIVALDAQPGHIGTMSAHVSPEHRTADIGILIGEREFWNRGYGLEAWQGVCDYLFSTAGMRKISAGALATNAAMLSIMRRAGMVDDGRRSRHCLVGGEEVDICHRALFREHWVSRAESRKV